MMKKLTLLQFVLSALCFTAFGNLQAQQIDSIQNHIDNIITISSDSIHHAPDSISISSAVSNNELLQQFQNSLDLCRAQIESLRNDSLYLSQQIVETQELLTRCNASSDSLAHHIIIIQSLSLEKDSVIDSLKNDLLRFDQLNERMALHVEYLSKLRDSLIISNNMIQTELQEKNTMLNNTITALQAKERLFIEKEELYKDAIANSNVDKVKLEGEINVKEISISAKATEIEYLQKNIGEKERILNAQQENYNKLSLEKERYSFLADSLRTCLVEAEKIILQKQEELKYTEKRAKEAEARIANAQAKKKKVAVIQGIAMKTFRTPEWSLRPTVNNGVTEYQIVNRNAGNLEFDYITGASVMLWDLTKRFQPDDLNKGLNKKHFDQDFSYSLGIYVGFGGSNLFKNFYVGPDFKFMDFFYFTAGVNVCEYELLNDNLQEGAVLPSGWSINDQLTKTWLVNMFFSLSLDLDFLSYIKK